MFRIKLKNKKVTAKVNVLSFDQLRNISGGDGATVSTSTGPATTIIFGDGVTGARLPGTGK